MTDPAHIPEGWTLLRSDPVILGRGDWTIAQRLDTWCLTDPPGLCVAFWRRGGDAHCWRLLAAEYDAAIRRRRVRNG